MGGSESHVITIGIVSVKLFLDGLPIFALIRDKRVVANAVSEMEDGRA